MTKSPSQAKEELLVENAILRYNEQVRKMLKEELSPLNMKITGLETRVENVEKRVKEIEDIVEPFGIIRKRFWLVLIVVALGSSVAGTKIADYLGELMK